VPYHVSLNDSLSNGQRYRVTIVDELDAATARSLGDWLLVASLNPSAAFELDLSRATEINYRALERMLARNEVLRVERRLELLNGRATSPASIYASYAPALAPLITAVAA
jgi:hypothetical protein